MTTAALRASESAHHPVQVHVEPALPPRARLTTAFRLVLAIPHALIVGGPITVWAAMSSRSTDSQFEWAAGAGVLGAVAAVATLIAWFAILFTGQHPKGLWDLSAFFLRWQVRVAAYITLLRDEYPPFGDGPYPVTLDLHAPDGARDRLTVFFRPFLAIPHLVVLWFLGLGWMLTTFVSWLAILFTGEMPETLRHFGEGVMRWSTRVTAYLLLLRDEYPPFSLA